MEARAAAGVEPAAVLAHPEGGVIMRLATIGTIAFLLFATMGAATVRAQFVDYGVPALGVRRRPSGRELARDRDTLLTSTAAVLDTSLVWTTLPNTAYPDSLDWPHVSVDMLYQSEPSDTCLALPGGQSARPVRSHGSALAAEGDAATEALGLGEIPTVTRIGIPSPNPSHGPFRVQLEIAPSHEGVYRVDVFDVAGRRVAVLVDGVVRAGRHTVEWRGRSESGRSSAPGVYFLRVTGPGIHKTSKLVMTR